MEKGFHIPVMVEEVMKYLITRDDGIYVDGTIGGGGHSEEILKRTKAKVIGFDIDPEAVKFASERLKSFGDRILILNRNYATLKESLSEIGVEKKTPIQTSRDHKGFICLWRKRLTPPRRNTHSTFFIHCIFVSSYKR